MTEKELLELCKEPKKRRKLFWAPEVYGFGKEIRRYGFFPGSWPLNIYMSHGITMFEEPLRDELENAAPVMFYFSPRLVDAFKKVSSKPCYCLMSPNVSYRRTKGINQDADARGTVAFLAHSTPVIEDRMDFSSYMQQLHDLPDSHKPVTVCLHYHDVNKRIHKPFIDAGFEVVTVGHPYREDFIERFYSILKRFKYVTSNEIGSYLFYACEMQIPFFLYGSEPVLVNHGDGNIETGSYTSYRRTKQYERVKQLFNQRVAKTTAEQLYFVETELGVYDSISRIKLAYLLYTSWLKFVLERVLRKLKKK